MKRIRIIIAGSRDFNDYPKLNEEVFRILLKVNMKYGIDKEQFEIVSGHARGADLLGERFADQYGIKKKVFPVTREEWNRFGKSAGYRRNAEMARYAVDNSIGILIAFWDKKSNGTKSMIELANRYKLNEVYVVNF